MAKKKYYAVKTGKIPGVYLSWEDCKKQVHGFPGAIYKSFEASEDAEAFVSDDNKVKRQGASSSEQLVLPHEGEAIAYVDGSFNSASNQYGCGVVLFLSTGTEEISELGKVEGLAEMRNVAGEILGARRAMERCVELRIRKLTIYHDYQGISSWCLGEWKTNKDGTKAYRAYFDSIKDIIDIQFCKIKGHSGDRYNERADELAKQAVFN